MDAANRAKWQSLYSYSKGESKGAVRSKNISEILVICSITHLLALDSYISLATTFVLAKSSPTNVSLSLYDLSPLVVALRFFMLPDFFFHNIARISS